MSLLAQGSEEGIEIAKKRFLQVNHHSGDKDLERRVFLEAYNIAYAIKVLVSNMPMQLKISKVSTAGKGGKAQSGATGSAGPVAANLLSLPLENGVKIDTLFDTIVRRAALSEASSTSGSKRDRGGNASSDSDGDSEEEAAQAIKKPRKKKRSGGGKK